MFSGIITDRGLLRRIEKSGDSRFVFSTAYDSDKITLGASIACSGVCLSVVEKGRDGEGNWFAADVSAQTLSCTTLGAWGPGSEVNLEQSLRLGDELGGHLVSGHVDGRARISSIKNEGDSRKFTFEAPEELMRLIAPKGSLAINGVSLTVNEVEKNSFGVNIIPHTFQETTFGQSREGDDVNLEVDMLARYVARLLESPAEEK